MMHYSKGRNLTRFICKIFIPANMSVWRCIFPPMGEYWTGGLSICSPFIISTLSCFTCRSHYHDNRHSENGYYESRARMHHGPKENPFERWVLSCSLSHSAVKQSWGNKLLTTIAVLCQSDIPISLLLINHVKNCTPMPEAFLWPTWFLSRFTICNITHMAYILLRPALPLPR